ncbi:MAG: CDP-alcohol phosphatidyltransferase family protein [Gemmatimonadota bacterium]|nr:CDP-alcohol phosphatidyltransferase family protein [Gemmatimonadota bacterium]MDH5283986.1 CDP-alcohol phosphatidyltransferase family protein [Gemmatimonadota bacterium]
MTRRAALTAPAAGDPHARVAGLTVLERQLFSLQDAGIDEVTVALPEEEIPRNPRLTMRVAGSGSGGSAPGAVLTARLGLVTHRSLPQRLVGAGYAGDIEAAALVAGEFVVPATDHAARRRAETLLLGSLIKPTDGLISRALNRPVSLRVTRALLDTSLTPNQMTIIAALFGAAAVVVVALGGAAWLFPGALLLHAQSVLDGCDGEISRLKYIRSRAGEWMDQLFDDFANLGFFAAAGAALYQDGVPWALGVTLGGVALHVAYQVALYTALLTRGGGSGSVTSVRWWGQKDWAAAQSAPERRNLFTVIRDAIEIGTRRDFFCFLWLPTVALGMGEIALVWVGFVFASSGIYTGLCWLLAGGPSPATRTS